MQKRDLDAPDSTIQQNIWFPADYSLVDLASLKFSCSICIDANMISGFMLIDFSAVFFVCKKFFANSVRLTHDG